MTEYNQQKQEVKGDQYNAGRDIHIHGIPIEQFRALSKELDITEVALGNFFKILEYQHVLAEGLWQ